ncbi:16S rRNA pseudouridine(516) synthase RsuA [sulfur-oxidizing endosymbiont of Gigantopelta aegis]|uniref:16S rRNA pseudouridine(516) synthase RsuA n=1 Tax=sulfur-oxidizing endosymbiont of Gigantopelta aegis TaxID=2794934 RepID=UPI0018DB26A4|nr:16S rRNA pseudouridine(516) synthase RsuA [sulfur-oxidizing endosymbiont of Gigantopelta aegis]
MRLDKYLGQNTNLSRSLAKKAISSGQISVNLECIKNTAFKVKMSDQVLYCGEPIVTLGHRYLMLNKPLGYICSTQDELHPSVLNLIDIDKPDRLHIVGRLDVDTTGLVLITDDGQWSHRITSPKRNCQKTYQVDLAETLNAALSRDIIERFKKGLLLKNEFKATLPAQLVIQSNQKVLLSIQEGRYHQVKRMFAAVGNHVEALHRVSIGAITLDTQLSEGEWRYLTEAEITSMN